MSTKVSAPATTLQTCAVHLMRNRSGLSELERAQGVGCGHQTDLYRTQHRGGCSVARCVWGWPM